MLNAQLTDEEGQQFQATAGQLNWTSTQTGPDIGYQACEISTSVKNATIHDFKTANKYTRKLKNSEVIWKFPNLRAYRKSKTQDPQLGPGNQDSKVRP